jgi:hypothetical protein
MRKEEVAKHKSCPKHTSKLVMRIAGSIFTRCPVIYALIAQRSFRHDVLFSLPLPLSLFLGRKYVRVNQGAISEGGLKIG